MGEDRHCWRAQVLPVGKRASKVCAEGCAGGRQPRPLQRARMEKGAMEMAPKIAQRGQHSLLN